MNDSETMNHKERCKTIYRDVGAQVGQILSDVETIKNENDTWYDQNGREEDLRTAWAAFDEKAR